MDAKPIDEFAAREIRFTGHLQRTALKPGDILVLTTDDYLSDAAVQRLKAAVQAMVKGEHEVLVLHGGLKLGVIEPT